MNTNTIVIVGAGIAGLTVAISLAQLGISSTILEAFEAPQEVGAGIQVPPNAWRILEKLGLGDALDNIAIRPQHIKLGDAHNAKIVLDLKVNTQDNGDDSFGVMHRARLHGILWDAAQKNDSITIETGISVEEIHERDDRIEISSKSASGSRTINASTVIGADGIWSNVRRFVPGAIMPKATGRIALRAVVPAREPAALPEVTAWMAPKSHLVTYPVRNKDTLNIVAIFDGAAHNAQWDTQYDGSLPGDLKDTLSRISSVKPDDIAFTRWPLFSVKPGGKWHSKRICLIGDAAHGIEPFAAQGAAMGIEDAFELAWFLKQQDLSAPTVAFEKYYKRRALRAKKVAKRTELNRFAYHQRGIGRWGRNFVFAAQPSDEFLSSLRWLYGYKAKGL